jgi:4-hydroxy-tetrahydrodipicolinate synthase
MNARDIEFGRLITAMVTPFHRDATQTIDHEKATQLARILVANGTDTIVVSGTTGESPTLSHDEKLALFRTVRDAVGTTAKVIAGTGNYNTRESIEFTHEVEVAAVADGVLLVVPYYNNPPQEGLYRHFRAIAESTSLPAMVYNVPSRTVRNMEAGTTIRLANDVPNIVGVKEATDNLDQVAEIISGVPSNFRLWSGNDGDIFTKMAVGGYGVVSVAAHVVGRLIRQMVDATAAGDLTEGARLHRHLLPVARILFPPVSPVASPASIKAAVALLGLDVGGLRLPMIELPDVARETLGNFLNAFDTDPMRQ